MFTQCFILNPSKLTCWSWKLYRSWLLDGMKITRNDIYGSPACVFATTPLTEMAQGSEHIQQLTDASLSHWGYLSLKIWKTEQRALWSTQHVNCLHILSCVSYKGVYRILHISFYFWKSYIHTPVEINCCTYFSTVLLLQNNIQSVGGFIPTSVRHVVTFNLIAKSLGPFQDQLLKAYLKNKSKVEANGTVIHI